MKKIYEYKMHRVSGALVHPEWVEDGGYFWNGSTYIAIIPDDQSRNYYVPDTLEELSKDDLINRLLEIQTNESLSDKYTNIDGSRMTSEEIIDFVNQWWDKNVIL